MDKCPYCGAETRPGDNFCLNCGNRLLSATPSSSVQQAQPVVGDATIPAPEDWSSNLGQQGGWPEHAASASAGASPSGHDLPTVRDSAVAMVQAPAQEQKIEDPARFLLRAENGDILQEYVLDKSETTIGRAPNSDILLSKDKLTSRRHATVRYEDGKYWLHDEHSANGTFVNGQQLEDTDSPYELHEGDQVGIGEHELVFRSAHNAIEDLPTQSVAYSSFPQEMTYRTRDDALATLANGDDYGTYTVGSDEPEPQPAAASVASSEPAAEEPAPVVTPPPMTPAVEPTMMPSSAQAASMAASAPVESSEAPAKSAAAESMASAPSTPPPATDKTSMALASSAVDTSDMSASFSRLTDLPLPALPDISPLMAALSALDGQVMSLQEQINATQDAMRSHDSEVAQTANQLRTGIRRVSDRMDSTIADVARSREALAWAELLQLMEDVMNNPRDIEYVTKLARKARELNKVFQIHQNVLNTMAECNSLLRSMIGE